MVQFLKRFKTMVPELFQLIILGVIGIYALFIELQGNSRILDFLGVFLPLALMLFAILLLVLKKQLMAAHVMMLITLFGNGLRSLISGLLSYHFAAEKFITEIDMYLILSAVASVYLMLIIISYVIDHKAPLKLNIKGLEFPLGIFVVFSYFCYGFDQTILFIFTAFIALIFGTRLGAVAILLAPVIIQPFVAINLFVDEFQKFTTIYQWLIYASSIYVIYVLIMSFIKEYKADPIKIDLPKKEDNKEE